MLKFKWKVAKIYDIKIRGTFEDWAVTTGDLISELSKLFTFFEIPAFWKDISLLRYLQNS